MEERVPAFPDVDSLDEEALKQLCRDLHGMNYMTLLSRMTSSGRSCYAIIFQQCAIAQTNNFMILNSNIQNRRRKKRNFRSVSPILNVSFFQVLIFYEFRKHFDLNRDQKPHQELNFIFIVNVTSLI